MCTTLERSAHVNIRSSRPESPKRSFLPDKEPKDSTGPEEDDFWRELFSGELQEIGVHLSPDHIATTMDGAQTVGNALRNTWDDLSKKISGLLQLGDLDTRISPEFREKATEVVMATAKGLGYTAAGLQGVGGLVKLSKGIKGKNLGFKIDGVFDLTTSAAVATTIAGLPVGPLILGPVAAGMGVLRGGYNAVSGFRKGDGRQEIQGGLDMARSASVGLRLMSHHSAALGAAGKFLGPVAGVIQAGRGYYDLSAGLAKSDKSKQVQGLTDIAAAAGLTVAMTGLGTIPGIALVAAAMGAKILYKVNDSFGKKVDRKLDDWNDGLKSAVKTVDKFVNPVIDFVRPLVEKTLGLNRGQAGKDPPREP